MGKACQQVNIAARRTPRTGRHRLRGACQRPTGICPPTGPAPPRSRRHDSHGGHGIDAHKRTHTAVIIDSNGRKLATKMCETTSKDHLSLLRWAAGHGKDRIWAVEDCRNMTRRLERDLLAAGERIVRVPPRLMANARDAARTYGKADPIDALAVARAALREDDLPTARKAQAFRFSRSSVRNPSTPRTASMYRAVSPSTPAVRAPLLCRTRSQATSRNPGSTTRLNRSSNRR
ncbi:IS110 family transposase [Plantactinospora sp. KLBMP9567]|uniref:IS110 family transposase n=1 Tax=Plantactinospora sp. KLBMP9567 TaxID=3085900 RepID=UPI002981AF17|nr:transposase [Plantactinospora sp. KLBMP9567]MDW5327134.1 transposase [Plantactinospora sp. KLBMP9567]